MVKTRTSLKIERNYNHYSTKSIHSTGVSDKNTKKLPVMVRDYQQRSNLRSPEVGTYIKINNNSTNYDRKWY
jgi:hypothetical protein